MRLQNKVALVTGAATGIGQAIATRFAQEGASVVIDYVGSPGSPGRTEEAIRAVGGKYVALSGDVSKPDQVQGLIAGAVKAFGRLDIVVNNVGGTMPGLLLNTTTRDLKDAFAFNVVTPET